MKKVLFVAIAAALFSSCKKDIYGCKDSNALNYSNVATIDDGSCMQEKEPEKVEIGKEYEYTLAFSSSQNENYFTVDNYETGDIVVTYVKWRNLSGQDYWTAIPLTIDGIAIVDDITTSGFMFITLGSPNDHTLYPYANPQTLTFKTIHIKGNFTSGLAQEDLKNYETVKQYISQ